MKGSDLLVAALENEGVERIYGIPGEENLDVIESLRKSSIELVLVRHEQVAAFMAATYGRLTGHPGVCLSTLGPGALNLTTGAAYAHLGAMPMIMLTGQKGVLSERQGSFQFVDTVRTMRPLTKTARQIVSPAMIPTAVRQAFRTAVEERPGPVHLELPEDIAHQECTTPVSMVPVNQIDVQGARTHAIQTAAQHLIEAKRPLVMLGAAASRPRLSGLLFEFFDRTGLPYFTTQMGKGSVGGNTDLYMGTAALSERDYVHEAIEEADVILCVGHDTSEKPPFLMHGKGPLVIHFGYQPAHIEAVYFPQVEVVGDIGQSLSRLADIVHGRIRHAQALLPLRKGILMRLLEHSEEDRWTPQRIVSDVRKVVPHDGIVTLDNGMYKIWFARNYRTSFANTLLLDNALATMGAGLASAMAASLLYPGRCVLAVSGDGGFMMNCQDLETAVRLKLNLVSLILVDNGFGMIKWKQRVDNFESFGLDFGNPDFVKLAESFGAKGRYVSEIEEFVPSLQDAFRVGGVHLIAVPIDYSDNVTVLIDELKKRLPVLPEGVDI